MGQYQDHAIVLRSRPYQEADSLLTLFCLHSGKIAAIARGARRPKSQLAAGLFPLSHSVVTLYRGRSSLETVSAAELVEGFPRLHNDLDRTAWAMALAGIAEELFSERDAEPAAFHLMRTVFQLLSVAKRSASLGLPTAWRFLHIAGLNPDLTHCGGCARVLPVGPQEWNPDLGAMMCEHCGGNRLRHVRQGSIETMRQWERSQPERWGSVVMDPVTRGEIHRMLQDVLVAHLGRLPRPWEFLNTVDTMSQTSPDWRKE